MIGLGLLRGVFLGGIMLWYSMSVWKTVDQYFRDQFQEYLTKEYEENSAMKKDVLLEKERLATQKILLFDRLGKLGSKVAEGQAGPEYYRGMDGVTSPSGGPWTPEGDGDGVPGHGGYSVEEVGSEEDQWEAGGEAHDEAAGPPIEGDDGECLVEDCGAHGDQVATRWRNVFDEEGDVCRSDEDPGAQGPCSRAGRDEDEEGTDGNQ